MSVRPIGPVTGAPEELIGDLAEWALEQRKEQIDSDTKVGGTWLGAISHPIFESLSNTGVQEAAAEVQEELDAPEPTTHLIDEMRESYGVGAELGGDDTAEAAEAAALIAAAIYERLGLTIPEEQEDDGRTASHHWLSYSEE